MKAALAKALAERTRHVAPSSADARGANCAARRGAVQIAGLLLIWLLRLALVLATSARADDWPQWRGPSRDGVWRESGLLERIPASGLEFRWRVKVGAGYSGPVVAQGRVFITDHQFNPEVERVLCFDEASGKPLWTHSYPCNYKDMEYGNGPRAAPTVHDGKVYTLGTQGHLVCLDAARGEVVWKKSVTEDLHGQIPRYGASAAPLVVDDLLIICAGGQPDASVVALDRKTGALRWKALPDRPAYSAPIVINAGGAQQLIVWTADTISSLAPATGKVHWQVPWKATFDPAQMVASPVWHKDMLMFLGAWSRGSKMLKLDSTRPEAAVLWETGTKPTTTISTPLFQDDDYFHAILGNGSLACLEAATGREVWSTREPTSGSFGNAHFTANGDRVFLFNHVGHLILSRLTPKGYEELGRCLLVEPTAGYRAQGPITWAHPAYANKSVFARNDRELVCASLAVEHAVKSSEWQPVVKARVLTYFEQNAALGLAFSPDGKTLALGTWQGIVKVLDLSSTNELPAPKRHHDWVCSVAFSPDGTTLATGSADWTVRLWDLATEKERAILKGHRGAVQCLVFSVDGNTLATGSLDETVKLWDVATRKERATLRGHRSGISAVAFSPDDRTLASAGIDDAVRLWDLNRDK